MQVAMAIVAHNEGPSSQKYKGKIATQVKSQPEPWIVSVLH
jgi:hypothetical protein